MGHHRSAIDKPDPALELFRDGFEQPGPLPEISEDGFPRPELCGQIPPRPGISQPVEEGLYDKVERTRRTSAGAATIFRSRFLSGCHY